MRFAGIGDEEQAQFEKDAAAFNGLDARRQRMASALGKAGYDCRQGLVAANTFVMRGADWLYHTLITVPLEAVKPPVAKAWRWSAKRLGLDKPQNPDSKINKFWRPLKEKLGNGAKKSGEFLEFHGALGLYNATKWLFDPRLPSGKPLLGNEKINKIVGTGIGVFVFVGLSAGVAWLEIISKVWHARIAQAALTSKAPLLLKICKQAILHPALTVLVTAAQFVVIPPIAAARQALKSTALSQAVAYRYNALRRAGAAAAPAAAQTSGAKWKPSTSVGSFFAEIAEKTSPEYYIARLRHFEVLMQERQAKKASAPPAVAPAPRDAGLAPVFTGGPALGKAFNDNAPAQPGDGSAGHSPASPLPPAKNLRP